MKEWGSDDICGGNCSTNEIGKKEKVFGIEIYFTDFTDAWSSLTVEDKTRLVWAQNDP